MPYTYEYPRPAVCVDIILFDKLDNPTHILLIKRKHPPYEHCWAFPGGFMDIDETLLEAANRELMEETGIVNVELSQFKVYDAINRDPRHRTISVAFVGFIDNNFTKPAPQDDAEDALWHELINLPQLAFDHQFILDEIRQIHV